MVHFPDAVSLSELHCWLHWCCEGGGWCAGAAGGEQCVCVCVWKWVNKSIVEREWRRKEFRDGFNWFHSHYHMQYSSSILSTYPQTFTVNFVYSCRKILQNCLLIVHTHTELCPCGPDARVTWPNHPPVSPATSPQVHVPPSQQAPNSEGSHQPLSGQDRRYPVSTCMLKPWVLVVITVIYTIAKCNVVVIFVQGTQTNFGINWAIQCRI